MRRFFTVAVYFASIRWNKYIYQLCTLNVVVVVADVVVIVVVAIDRNEKGRRTFYHNALRSEIVSKSKLKSFEGQA